MGDRTDGRVLGRRLRDCHHDRALLRPAVDDDEVRAITIATTPNVGFYVGVTVLAIVLPKVAAFGFLGAVSAVFRARGDRRPLPSA